MKGRFICADVTEGLRQVESNSIGLTVTSPPYDALRDYRGTNSFNVFLVAAELQRITRPGGIVVWIVNDQVIDGSESCSSFRHALAFRSCGWRLHDTMIYERFSPFPDSNRYRPTFEYMFVFSRGKPKTFRPIEDRPSKNAGQRVRGTERQQDGSLKMFDRGNRIKAYGRRTNIWYCPAGNRKTAPDCEVHEHPAAFPLRLVADHIRSWSNPGDRVLDCFGGSGQTAIAAEMLGREWTLIDVEREYLALARRRLKHFRAHRETYESFCQLAVQ